MRCTAVIAGSGQTAKAVIFLLPPKKIEQRKLQNSGLGQRPRPSPFPPPRLPPSKTHGDLTHNRDSPRKHKPTSNEHRPVPLIALVAPLAPGPRLLAQTLLKLGRLLQRVRRPSICPAPLQIRAPPPRPHARVGRLPMARPKRLARYRPDPQPFLLRGAYSGVFLRLDLSFPPRDR